MKNLKHHIAIIGASGNVGRKLLEVMEKRALIPERLSLLASARSAGKQIMFNGQTHHIAALDDFDFADVDLAFFCAGAKIAEQYAPRAAQAGALIIDLSSHFRMDEDVPLCVPEVNPEALSAIPRNIIANPNCSTAQLVLVLAALHRAKPIARVMVATYQSVSGAGKKAMDQLCDDLKQDSTPRSPASLAFNVIPKIDVWLDNGESKEEWKMRVEVAKILDPNIKLSTHCVRVPVLVGHSEAVFARFHDKITPEEACAILAETSGCQLIRDGHITPIECEGKDDVFVSRVRQDPNDDRALQLWIAADNLLKGAALNAVQIAEALISLQSQGPASSPERLAQSSPAL